MDQPTERVVFSVSKYNHDQCPHCQHPFRKWNEDWRIETRPEILLPFFSAPEPRTETQPSVAHCLHEGHYIQCLRCEEYMWLVEIESWCVDTMEKAQKLLEKGFVSLTEWKTPGDVPNSTTSVHTVKGRVHLVIES